MTFYPVTGGAQCTIVQDFRGQLTENVLWFLRTGSTIGATDLQNLANDLMTYWGSGPASLLSSDVTFRYVLARDFTFAEGFEAVGASVEVVGTAGDAMPNNVALAFSLRTGLAGRANRGRIYIAGIPRSAVVENSVSAAGFAADMLISLGGMVGLDTVSPGWTWGVAHRRQTVTPGEPPVWLNPGIINPIVNVTLTDDTVDSQRRRLPGRGR